MTADTEKVAVIDIGSNSVRLFIYQFSQGTVAPIYNNREFCGLGKDLPVSGKLNLEAAEAALVYLKSLLQPIKEYAVSETIVIGTAALREATNAQDFINLVKSETGFDIKVIDGEVEALLAAKGLLLLKPDAEGIVADFGGGSLELARITNKNVNGHASFKLGAHYLKGVADPESLIQQTLKCAEFINPPFLYITGGAWRSVVKAFIAENDLSIGIEDIDLHPEELMEFSKIIGTLAPQELMDRYGIEFARASLMDVSALMLCKLIECLRPKKIAVSVSGIRDGIIYDLIYKSKV